MIVSIEVEDEAWSALADLERVTERAVAAALAAVPDAGDSAAVDVLFTDDSAMTAINAEWRGKNSATNVLSFPTPDDMPITGEDERLLGDIVLASGVVSREAEEQGKTLHEHTVHLIVHGTLHLLGYDHADDAEAEEMEQLEAEILKGLGIPNPYERQ
jgi:probable rRNA maturation factor